MMDPERWQRANALFEAALTQAPTDRSAFIISACGADDELRQFVERLVLAHERAGVFLDVATLKTRRFVASGSLPAATHIEDAPPEPGSAFHGTDRFSVRRLLGSGGMGVVYEVLDRARGEIVALKTLRHARAADMYRLKREFRTLADIAHPNLVSLYELIVDGTNCFFTMELVVGMPFADYVRDGHDSLDASRADRARRALIQLIDGVAALHRSGRLHRDLKPSNVLVTSEGHVAILDFGLSAVVGDFGHVTEWLAGTPAYFAPERHGGVAPSNSQDWYSVGVTLYEALTGRLPFRGALAETLRRQRDSDPDAAEMVAAGVPEDLSAICIGLLRRDPERRFTDRDVRRILARDASMPVDALLDEDGQATFVGRRRELAALIEAARAARNGRATAVYVHGSSGIGKSALVQSFLREPLMRDTAVVLRGRCYEHESVPYKALDGVIDNLSQHLAVLPRSRLRALIPPDMGALCRLFPVMRRIHDAPLAADEPATDPVALRERGVAALRLLLGNLASQRPLVMYIDDLHWSDTDSAVLLEQLVRLPDAPPMLLVACLRAEEIASKPFLDGLMAESPVTIRLDALSAIESREVIAVTTRPGASLSDDEVDAIVNEAGGNPFLLRRLTQHACLPPAWRAEGRTVAEMLLASLRGLPPEAAPFLRMLALCGRPMAPDLVCEAAGIEGGNRPLLRRLRASHCVRFSGSAASVDIYHDRIREAIVASLPDEERRRLHGFMARAMEARTIEDAEALYEHHREAGNHPAAAAQAAAAARKADTALAFARAAQFYQAALDLEPAAADSLTWQMGLAAALANVGQPVASAERYLTAARAVDGWRRVECQRLAAEQFLVGGHVDRGLETIRIVLHAVGMVLPRDSRWTLAALAWTRARLWWRGWRFVERSPDQIPGDVLLRIDTCWSMATGLMLVDPLRAALSQSRCLLLALESGDASRIARSMVAEAGFRAVGGGKAVQSTARAAQRAQRVADRVGTPQMLVWTMLSGAVSAYMAGRWSEARLILERAIDALTSMPDMASELALARNVLIGSLSYEGRIRDVARLTTQLLTAAREHGNAYWDTELRTRQTLVWLARDEPDEATRNADAGIARWSQEGFHRQHYGYVLAHVQAELYRGRAERAWHLFEEMRPALRRSLHLRIQWTRIEAAYVRARCALLMAASAREPSAYIAVAVHEVRRIERERMAWSDPLANLLRGALAFLDHDLGSARTRLVAAIQGFERAGMRLYEAAARRRLSELTDDNLAQMNAGEAERWMANEGIVSPARMTRLIAPGFADPAETVPPQPDRDFHRAPTA